MKTSEITTQDETARQGIVPQHKKGMLSKDGGRRNGKKEKGRLWFLNPDSDSALKNPAGESESGEEAEGEEERKEGKGFDGGSDRYQLISFSYSLQPVTFSNAVLITNASSSFAAEGTM
jgi:hypothetical protein